MSTATTKAATSTGTPKPPGITPWDIGLTLGGEMLSSVSEYLAGGEDRRFQKRMRGQLPGLESAMDRGLSINDLNPYLSAAFKSAQPAVNQVAKASTARWGSLGSGKAASSMAAAVSQNLANPIAQLAQMVLANNQANLRTRYQTTAGLAGV